jgi:hypothetical protein
MDSLIEYQWIYFVSAVGSMRPQVCYNQKFTVNETLKGEDLLLQVQLHFGCCEELGAKLNLCLDMKFRLAPSSCNDLKLASYKNPGLDKKIKDQEWKKHQTDNHILFSVTVYVIL